MPGQRRTIRDQFAEHWTPRARATAGLAALAVLAAAGTAAFVFLTGGNQRPHPRPLSTTLASQQLVGLAVPGPGHGSPQRLLAPSANAASFIPGGPGATVLPNERWQADKMTDGSYVLVNVPEYRGSVIAAHGGRAVAEGLRPGPDSALAPPLPGQGRTRARLLAAAQPGVGPVPVRRGHRVDTRGPGGTAALRRFVRLAAAR